MDYHDLLKVTDEDIDRMSPEEVLEYTRSLRNIRSDPAYRKLWMERAKEDRAKNLELGKLCLSKARQAYEVMSDADKERFRKACPDLNFDSPNKTQAASKTT